MTNKLAVHNLAIMYGIPGMKRFCKGPVQAAV